MTIDFSRSIAGLFLLFAIGLAETGRAEVKVIGMQQAQIEFAVCDPAGNVWGISTSPSPSWHLWVNGRRQSFLADRELSSSRALDRELDLVASPKDPAVFALWKSLENKKLVVTKHQVISPSAKPSVAAMIKKMLKASTSMVETPVKSQIFAESEELFESPRLFTDLSGGVWLLGGKVIRGWASDGTLKYRYDLAVEQCLNWESIPKGEDKEFSPLSAVDDGMGRIWFWAPQISKNSKQIAALKGFLVFEKGEFRHLSSLPELPEGGTIKQVVCQKKGVLLAEVHDNKRWSLHEINTVQKEFKIFWRHSEKKIPKMVLFSPQNDRMLLSNDMKELCLYDLQNLSMPLSGTDVILPAHVKNPLVMANTAGGFFLASADQIYFCPDSFLGNPVRLDWMHGLPIRGALYLFGKANNRFVAISEKDFYVNWSWETRNPRQIVEFEVNTKTIMRPAVQRAEKLSIYRGNQAKVICKAPDQALWAIKRISPQPEFEEDSSTMRDKETSFALCRIDAKGVKSYPVPAENAEPFRLQNAQLNADTLGRIWHYTVGYYGNMPKGGGKVTLFDPEEEQWKSFANLQDALIAKVQERTELDGLCFAGSVSSARLAKKGEKLLFRGHDNTVSFYDGTQWQTWNKKEIGVNVNNITFLTVFFSSDGEPAVCFSSDQDIEARAFDSQRGWHPIAKPLFFGKIYLGREWMRFMLMKRELKGKKTYRTLADRAFGKKTERCWDGVI